MYSHHSSLQGVRQMSKDTGGPIGASSLRGSGAQVA